MDIYNFINSKAISEHCRSINHQFNPLETAFLISRKHGVNIKQKHRAWNEIITTMSDMEIKERYHCPYYDSLHQFLTDYMALENGIIESLKQDTSEAVYNYSTYYIDDNGNARNDDRLFATLGDAFRAIKEENKDNDIYKCRIQKRWIGEKEITIDFTTDWEAISIVNQANSITEAEQELLWAFEGMWFEIPTPFEKGDILIGSSPLGGEQEIFVLNSICYWDNEKLRQRLIDNGDETDMCASGYWINNDGNMYGECMHSYQNLEYYQGELLGYNRILKPVSSFVKGNIDIILLVNSCNAIWQEESAKMNMDYVKSNFMDEGLKLVGIDTISKYTLTHKVKYVIM